MGRVPGVFVLSDANAQATAAWDGAAEALADGAGAWDAAEAAAEGELALPEQAAARTATNARAATPFKVRMCVRSPTGWCAADCTVRHAAVRKVSSRACRHPPPAAPSPRRRRRARGRPRRCP